MTKELREGDVYRWSWNPGTPEGEKFEPYWCKSRIAIVSGGRLFDTYWHSTGEALDAGRVSLEWVANMEDIEAARADAHEVYEPADVVDLRHANGGLVYRRKGAKPSKRVQVEAWTRKRDRALREADYAQDRIDELLATTLVCAWRHAHEGEKWISGPPIGSGAPVSHGLCSACEAIERAAWLAEAEEMRAARERAKGGVE